ncbi:MAG: histidine kinase [Verrucomicrobia bacterium]|nr:histidine kinase [Verrucomicrobiota bacterium]
MSDPSPSRIRRPLALFALQAAIWTALTFAFAVLLVLVGPFQWSDALGLSAVNWIPWVALTPIIFWLCHRFPLERGRLLRSLPVHFVAALLCTIISLWVTAAVFAPVRGAFGPGSSSSGGRGGRGGFLRDASDTRRPPPEWRERRPMAGPDTPILLPDEARPPGPNRRDDARPPAPRPPNEFRGSYPRGGGDFRGGFPRGGDFGGPGGPQSPTNLRYAFLAAFNPLSLRGNFGLAIYLIVMSGAHALAYYRRVQERDRQALVLTAGLNQARLDALRLQLQPHFLFNTLNAISTLVHRDANAADELISDLSDLLRASLENKDHEVPLAREIELLDRYLAIEQTRLGDRLRIVRDIDPLASAALVPTFLLQPIAENAIRHGLEPRLAPGTLILRARRDGNLLRLSLADDGVGLKAAASDPATARHGIGLANSIERLRTLHGGRASLELLSPPEGGVRVEVVLPFVTERSVVGAAALA